MRFLLLGFVSSILLAGSPENSGDLRGIVLDPSGAPLSDARVALRTASMSSSAAGATDSQGRFQLVRLAPGSYVLTVAKPGFSESRTAVDVGTLPGAELTVRMSLSAMSAEVTVTAQTGQVVAAESIAQPITIIPQEELYQRAMVLSDVADGEAGVQQLRTSPTLGAFFVRGLTGKNVAIFRDGVRYTTSAQRGGISTFLNLMDPEGLDSVEVLRGPNSAQYGSDSLGGTVAVVSRPADLSPSGPVWHGQWAPFFQSASNSFGSSAALNYGGPRFGVATNLVGRRVNTMRTGGGIDSHAAVTRFLGLPSNIMGERLPDTAFTGYGGDVHMQLRTSANSQFVAHYDRGQQDGGKRYDQLLGGDGNWIADLRNLMLDFGYLRYQHFALGPLDQLSVTASYNAQREERVNQGGQGNPNGSVTHQYEKTKVWGLQFFVSKHIRRLEWLFGGEGYFESIAAPSFSVNPVSGATSIVRPRIPDGAQYYLHGLYTQATWQPLKTDRLRLSGAMRFGGASYNSRASRSPLVNGRPLWPDDSLSANAFSGRAGAVIRANSSIFLHANYSRGFRVPNVTDLGTLGLQGSGAYEAAFADLAGRNAIVGDRADDQAQSTGLPIQRLRPELTDNVDYGVRLRNSRIDADFTGFWMRLDNSVISQTLILPQGAVGQSLGEQTISRQIASGAVFVPLSATPVLVRANFSGARMRGIEQSLRAKLSSSWSIRENLTYVYSEDSRTGLPPDIEPGIPALTLNPAITCRPAAKRFWVETYGTFTGRQDRLSSLALSDRRIGNPRSRSNIQSFFNNGARTRGLVVNGILTATGETLGQVQDRVLGTSNSAPQFTAIAGFGVVGLRGGVRLGERTDLMGDFSNLADKNYRGIGWGVDGPGRGATVRLRYRF